MKNLKKLLILIFTTATVFLLVGCSLKSQKEANEFATQLLALEGVVKVEQVEQSFIQKLKDKFNARYMVEFEQPISWKDSNIGKFNQRVFIGYKDKNRTNVFL